MTTRGVEEGRRTFSHFLVVREKKCPQLKAFVTTAGKLKFTLEKCSRSIAIDLHLGNFIIAQARSFVKGAGEILPLLMANLKKNF